MGGKYSRDKGRRGEYSVRDELRAGGFVADRVPLSGASAGFKGDIRASKNGRTYVFEVKCRATGFKAVYDLFAKESEDGVLRLAVAAETGEAGPVCINISNSADGALGSQGAYLLKAPSSVPGGIHTKRLHRKLLNMRKWLQGADVLVIKSDRCQNLYLRYT